MFLRFCLLNPSSSLILNAFTESATHGHAAFVLKMLSKSAIRPSADHGDGCLIKIRVTNNLSCVSLFRSSWLVMTHL